MAFLDENGLNTYHQGVKNLIEKSGKVFVISICADSNYDPDTYEVTSYTYTLWENSPTVKEIIDAAMNDENIIVARVFHDDGQVVPLGRWDYYICKYVDYSEQWHSINLYFNSVRSDTYRTTNEPDPMNIGVGTLQISIDTSSETITNVRAKPDGAYINTIQSGVEDFVRDMFRIQSEDVNKALIAVEAPSEDYPYGIFEWGAIPSQTPTTIEIADIITFSSYVSPRYPETYCKITGRLVELHLVVEIVRVPSTYKSRVVIGTVANYIPSGDVTGTGGLNADRSYASTGWAYATIHYALDARGTSPTLVVQIPYDSDRGAFTVGDYVTIHATWTV